jgi:hypothetical protein
VLLYANTHQWPGLDRNCSWLQLQSDPTTTFSHAPPRPDQTTAFSFFYTFRNVMIALP